LHSSILGKLIHKPNSGLRLSGKKTEDPKSKRKEEKNIIKIENISPNKIVVCTEMVMYYT
jgi:hypothetical protein